LVILVSLMAFQATLVFEQQGALIFGQMGGGLLWPDDEEGVDALAGWELFPVLVLYACELFPSACCFGAHL
jgi:hypothetical protein